MSLNLTPLDIKPGLYLDETAFRVGQGGYVDVSNVRPNNGSIEPIGGWEFLSTTPLDGKCRGIYAWRDNQGSINFAFGTSEKLYVLVGGGLYDITPTDFVAGNEDGIAGAGYGTGAYGSGTYGGAYSGDLFPMSWSFGNYGEWLIANARGQKIWVWRNDITANAVELAPETELYEADFTSYADQTAFDGDWTRGTGWTFDAGDDEADCDGTQTADSDLTYDVTTVARQRYRVTVTFSRTAGAISAIGAGAEGETSESASGSVSVVFIASSTTSTVGARGDSDFIGSVSSVEVETLAAPTSVGFIDVTPSRQIVAYDCTEEASDTVNPRCVRWCDIEDVTDWTTTPVNNAGEFILRSAGGVICSRYIGDDALVWTDSEVFVRQYLGAPGQTFRFTKLGDNCGICGPNAAAVLGQVAYWVGPDFRFRRAALGGEPEVMAAPIAQAFEDAQVPSQQEKIFLGRLSQYNEIWCFYPHVDDGNECSRYFAYNQTQGKWFAGLMDRTAWRDASPYGYPVAVDADGYAYIHERGRTANGSQLNWHAETGDIRLKNSSELMQLRGMRPDIDDQVGRLTLTLRSRAYPQGDVTDYGPYMVEAGADKVDFRATGALIRLRWEGAATVSFARLGSPVFDMTTRGRR